MLGSKRIIHKVEEIITNNSIEKCAFIGKYHGKTWYVIGFKRIKNEKNSNYHSKRW